VSITIFYTSDHIRCRYVLCKLCANGIPLAGVVVAQYRNLVAVVDNIDSAIGNYSSNKSCEGHAFRIDDTKDK
jgi:hypothetical protein